MRGVRTDPHQWRAMVLAPRMMPESKLLILLILPFFLAACGGSGDRVEIQMPSEELLSDELITERGRAQLANADQIKVFTDFGFTDKRVESGISFQHKMVDNSGIDFKGAHYDHGNGLAVADVDNDGFFDLYFVNQVGGNELWRNLGNGTFENYTEAAGLAMVKPVSVAASFADTDNDGDQDLMVTTVRSGNRFFENDGTGHYKDITDRSGLGFRGHSSGAVFFDYNNDGLLDIFLSNVGVYTENELAPILGITRKDNLPGEYSYYPALDRAFSGHLMSDRSEKSILYKNIGGNKFLSTSRSMGLEDVSWTGDATPIDANGDGWQDLYILNMQGVDRYYENVQGEQFVDKTSEYFGKTPWGSMSSKVFDYNNDGRLDLYVTDMHSDMWQPDEFIDAELEGKKPPLDAVPPESHMQSNGQSLNGNALFRKDADGSFSEHADALGAETFWPWGFSVGDLNADGFEDIFVASSMNFPFRYQANIVLLNEEGKSFKNAEYILGVEPRPVGRRSKLWFEVECYDGADHSLCEEYGRESNFDVYAALGSRSSVVIDIDNDGDQDIVTSDYNSEPMVLISNLSDKKERISYIKVILEGRASNRDGLGSIVTVKTKDASYTKVYDGVSGYLSHGNYPLYFGLADSKELEQIEVLWTSGTKQVLKPTKINDSIRIVEAN